jgi:HK97 gp10 family phage protein
VIDSAFNWNSSWADEKIRELDTKLAAFGGHLANAMQQFAPIETGALRQSIVDTYDVTTHTLTIYIGAPYGVYQEFGTRFIPPHPFIRPAIVEYAAVFQAWGLSAELLIHPPAQLSEPIRATTSGFKLPKHQRLTAAQVERVNKYLRPTSRKFAQKFKRRHVAFSVVGPKA